MGTISAAEVLGVARRIDGFGRRSTETVARDRRRRLTAVVRHAAQCSPFYRELYRDVDLDSFELSQLPTVDKRQLMQRYDEVVTDDRLRRSAVEEWLAEPPPAGELFAGHFVIASSSGTSGHRGIFAYGRHEWIETRAILSRAVRPRSISWRRLVAALTPWYRARTALVASPGHNIEVLFQAHAPGIAAYLNETRIVDVATPVNRMADQLADFDPQRLMGYPTALEALAEEQRSGRLRLRLREISSFAEQLTRAGRSLIEESFGCPVFEVYGATESVVMARDCQRQRCHVESDLVVLEPVQEDGTPTPPGAPSHSCLLTSLVHRAQPIIRYDIGDSIVPGDEPCPCGAPSPTIEVAGRREDVFCLTDRHGAPVRLLPLAVGARAADVEGIDQFQVRQEQRDLIRILFVPRTGWDIATVAGRLVSNLQSLLAAHGAEDAARVEAVPTTRISRSPGGKLVRVVSLVRDPPSQSPH